MNDPHHQSQVPAAAKKRKYLVDVFTPTNNKVKKTESANISCGCADQIRSENQIQIKVKIRYWMELLVDKLKSS